SYLPEAMCQVREQGLYFEKINAVAVGPGLGTGEDALQLLEQIIKDFKQPIVIDADAINILSQHKYLLQQFASGNILTRHHKEFERLFGVTANDFERMEMALQQSAENNCIIVLKGRYTLVTKGGEGWFNT